MENRLEQLLVKKPELLDELTKFENADGVIEFLSKYLDHYSKAELNNDLTRLKNGKFTEPEDEEINMDQLEQVAGGTLHHKPGYNGSRLDKNGRERLRIGAGKIHEINGVGGPDYLQ